MNMVAVYTTTTACLIYKQLKLSESTYYFV
jgi:hypothetical protein